MKKHVLLTLLSTGLLAAPGFSEELSSSASDQTDLHLTIYNSNVALVKDKRRLQLPTGVQQLAFKDVSASIQPQTAILSADAITLLEQNFEYDLLSPQALLDKFVGKNVILERLEDDKVVREQAQVLANNDGSVLKVGEQIRTNRGVDNLVFDDIPNNLRARPTLTMVVDNQSAEQQDVALSYLSAGLNWNADYVIALRDDDVLDLKGWVTLTNNSGTTYKDANLQLVAGEVNRVMEDGAMMVEGAAAAPRVMAKKAQPTMRQESLFEYHLYSLDRKTTIKQNQQKQVSLFEANAVPYSKQLVIDANDPYGWSHNRKNKAHQTLKAQSYIVLENKKEDELGMPFPAGVVRTYQKDSHDNMQFIGEDRIKHTPENEQIKLVLGESFDITAKRKQTDYNYQEKVQKTAVSEVKKAVVTATYEVLFSNAKDQDEVVFYDEHFFDDWEIVEQSLNSEKRNSAINRWAVNIPAKGEKKLTFTVRLTYLK